MRTSPMNLPPTISTLCSYFRAIGGIQETQSSLEPSHRLRKPIIALP
jgi:hypothetical protein